VGAKVRVFIRNPDELANERAELARLLNKAGTCFLHGTSLSTASACACGGGFFKDKLFVTTLSLRIIAHICSLIMWFIFNLQRKSKQLEIHTFNRKSYKMFLQKTSTLVVWVKTAVDMNIWPLVACFRVTDIH
jgi:hypothetical protein